MSSAVALSALLGAVVGTALTEWLIWYVKRAMRRAGAVTACANCLQLGHEGSTCTEPRVFVRPTHRVECSECGSVSVVSSENTAHEIRRGHVSGHRN